MGKTCNDGSSICPPNALAAKHPKKTKITFFDALTHLPQPSGNPPLKPSNNGLRISTHHLILGRVYSIPSRRGTMPLLSHPPPITCSGLKNRRESDGTAYLMGGFPYAGRQNKIGIGCKFKAANPANGGHLNL